LGKNRRNFRNFGEIIAEILGKNAEILGEKIAEILVALYQV
jgi:hypothetical protein